MVTALFDTNVIIDMLLDREPWIVEAVQLFEAIRLGRSEPSCRPLRSRISSIYAGNREGWGSPATRSVDVSPPFEVIGVDDKLIHQALALPIEELEDALQVACAVRAGLDFLVTRDARGFLNSPIPAVSPTELLVSLSKPQTPSP